MQIDTASRTRGGDARRAEDSATRRGTRADDRSDAKREPRRRVQPSQSPTRASSRHHAPKSGLEATPSRARAELLAFSRDIRSGVEPRRRAPGVEPTRRLARSDGSSRASRHSAASLLDSAVGTRRETRAPPSVSSSSSSLSHPAPRSAPKRRDDASSSDAFRFQLEYVNVFTKLESRRTIYSVEGVRKRSFEPLSQRVLETLTY